MEAIDYMWQNQLYKEMVIYVDTSYAGTMFKALDPSKKVYVMSATSETGIAWGHYCTPLDWVQGSQMRTCLGN